MAPGNYHLRGGGSAEALSERWFREVTLGELIRPNYSPEGGSAEITFGEVVRPSYSPEGGSGNLLSGRWFGRIKVVPGKYSRGGGSAELLSGRWFREITLGEAVRPN